MTELSNILNKIGDILIKLDMNDPELKEILRLIDEKVRKEQHEEKSPIFKNIQDLDVQN